MSLFNNKITRATRQIALMLLASFLLVSCGGGGGGGSTSGNSAPGANEVIISGRAAKGTILNATVRATQIIKGQLSGTSKDVALGTNGDFSVSMPKGLVHLQVIPNKNSTTQDEATGVAVALPLEFRFRAAADLTDSTATTVNLNITPFSEIGVALTEKNGGLTAANINKANSGVANILGFDHLGTTPIQSNDTAGLTSATVNEKKLSVLNAAVSNMAATDALSCGVQATYGQTINCTVAKLAEQFQMSNAATVLPLAVGVVQSTTANSTPMVLLGDTGYQSFQVSIADVIAEFPSALTALKNTVIDIAQDGLALSVNAGTYAVCLTTNTCTGEALLSYQATLSGRYNLIDSANVAYKYAVISKLVYDDKWVNGNSPGEVLPLPVANYTALNLLNYGLKAQDIAAAWVSGLQWNAFYNSDEIIFAYRGTTSAGDWWVNLFGTNVACQQLLTFQYNLARNQFTTLVSNQNFKTFRGTRKIVITGHSLGGGIASYIAGNSPLVSKAVGFNSAPLCGLTPYEPGFDDSKTYRVTIMGDPVSNLDRLFPVYYPRNAPIRYPSPYAWFDIQGNHSMDTVLFALGEAKRLCSTSPACVAQNSTQPIQTPIGSNLPLAATGIRSSYSTGITPYRPPISLTGTNLSAINQISWACTQPNGAACSGSPYIWTPNDWTGKVDIFNDTSIKIYPTLLTSGDTAGTYNWTATFSALNSTPVSIPFSVTYSPQLATGIVVDNLSSAMFTSGATTISTTTSPVVAVLSVMGKNLSTVSRIEWRWSGATTGSKTWLNTDPTWGSKVAYTPDGKLVLSPTVVEANPTWSGTAIWAGTLMDATGASQNITFSVIYQPNTSPPTCTPPQVLTNGVCVTPPPTSGAPAAFTLSATTQCSGTSPQILLSGWGSSGFTTFDIYRNGSLLFPANTGSTFLNTSVVAGTTYTYSVTAKNASGSTSSNTISVTAPTTCGGATGGAAPAAFTLSATTQCSGISPQILLSGWGSSGFTTFDLYRDGILYSPANTGSSFLNTSVVASATYTYSVTAKNASGSTSSNTISVTASTCGGTAPTAPSGLAALPASNFMSLAWNDSSNETGFYVERKTGVSGTWSQIASVGQNIGAYLDYGVSAGVTYYYRISAYNAFGVSGYTNEVSVTIVVVTAPTAQSLAATLITSTTAQMNASINPNGLSTSGYFEYGTTTGYGSSTASGTFSGTTVIPINSGMAGLTPNTTYHYRAVATNSGGTSRGGDVTFTTTASPLVVNGIASSYFATSGTYQPAISLSGSGFNSVNQIYLTCSKSSISCGNYTWTSANWSGKFGVLNDTSAVFGPVLTVSSDLAGIYNWSVTFSGGGQTATKNFTVTK